MASEEVNAILDERIQYSSYSAEESFTLSDVMAEKDEIDENKLLAAEVIEDDLFDDYFDDQGMFDDQLEQKTPEPEAQKLEEVPVEENKDKVEDGEYVKKEGQQSNEAKGSQEVGKEADKVDENQQVDRCGRIQNTPVPPLSQIRNIAFIVLNNVTAAFDQTSRGVGIPTVITSNSIKYLAIGTSFGNVVLFEVGNKGKHILGTADNRKYGPITAICISREGRYLVCGQENGLITIWDLTTMSEIKKELATDTKIVKMLFCSESQFILADLEGNVYLFTIENYFWIKLKKDRLFEKSNSVFYDVKVHTLQTAVEVIVLCSLEQVLVATYKPKVEAIDRIIRPDNLVHSKVPNIEIGKTAVLYLHDPSNKHFQYNDVLCVSWGNQILVYKFMEGVRLEKLQLVYRFSQETPIYNMEFISEGVLVTLDNQQTYHSFRLWINSGGGHQLLNQKVIPEEVLYQRFIRDHSNRFIKIFNNTIISCSFNPRQKELFFICKNSIYRCRVYKWNEYISDLIIADDQCELALKVCIQIYYGRLDIFLEPIIVNDKTKKILYQVGNIYMKKRFETIEKLKLDRARNMEQKDDLKNVKSEVQQTYQCIIEYMLEIRCCNQLITSIYQDFILRKFRQQEYHNLFLDCLKPFILKGRITSLPSKEIFQELMDYYLPQNKRELVDNLIMFLDVETLDMFYEQAIDICSQNKLYRALAYVCSTHKDYVPPLTSLLNEIRIAQNEEPTTVQEAYYTILKDYIVKLLGGCYINGISFNDYDLRMKKSLSNWLMCRQTFSFFTKNKMEAYRHDYFYFVEELIYLLSSQPQEEEYIHSQLRHITLEEFHDRQVAQLFIKISQTITLEPDELKIIVNYSDKELIEKYLAKYLHFYKTYHTQLNQLENIKVFVKINPQLHYFHYVLKANIKGQRTSILEKVDLSNEDHCLNGQLTKYLLNRMKSQDILWDVEELLKIHSQNTMIFMLERFSLDTVSQRILGIEDRTYRYLIIRKLLKKLRKENNGGQKKDKIRKFHRKKAGNSYNPTNPTSSGGSFLAVPQRNTYDGESDTESVIEIKQVEMSISPNRKLNKEVMQFYIECLCKYKNQKRVYYQLICNMEDYYDTVSELICIIEKYQFESCLGLLEEARKNYEKAYKHYQKVYRHFFFEENYKKLINYVNCHGRFARRMFERMLSITNILGNDERWMEILRCIINPLEEKSVKSHHKGKRDQLVCDDIEEVYTIPKEREKYGFIKQLGQIIEECLINVSTKISIEGISTFIGEHRRVFSRMFVLEAFRATLVTYSNNARIYHITNEMVIQDQVNTFENIYQFLLRGFPPGLKCEECQEPFDEENPCKSYLCGHSYHQVCPNTRSQMKSKVSYRTSSSLAKEGEANSRVLKDVFDRCPKCDYNNTEGQVLTNDPVLPDFHKQYEESLLMKGMVGIVTIIPNMIVAIPESLTALGSLMRPIEEKILEPIEEEEFNTQLDDQVLGFLAFTQNLHELEQENDRFIHECGKYFDEVR